MSVTPEAIAARRRALLAARGPARRLGCAIPVFLFGLVMIIPFVAVLTAVWPGVLKYTAPIVCDEGYDDTVVARDTYHSGPGETSTTFTLYCMNDRGEVSDEGAFRPGAIVFAACAAVYVVLVVLLVLRGVVRRRRRRGDPDTGPGDADGGVGPWATEQPWAAEQPWMPGQSPSPFGGTILPAPGAPPVPPGQPVPPRSSPIPPPPPT